MAAALPKIIDGTINPSFAFATITERWPKIVTKIIDQLHQKHADAANDYGQQGSEDLNSIIAKISELRYRIVTDKPLMDVADDVEDHAIWNGELQRYRRKVGEANATWFKLPWLFTECFMYRKLYEFFLMTTHFRHYDPFAVEKKRSYQKGLTHIIAISTELNRDVEAILSTEETRKILMRLLQVSLWSNKCDLSLSGGDSHSMSATIFEELDDLRPFILSDNLAAVCDKFLGLNAPLNRVDIVLDNAGLEVFTDLCLADFLVSKGLTKRIVLHGKAHPWYVSDTTLQDFNWVIEQLTNADDESLRKVGSRWHRFCDQGVFEFKAHIFFTLCFSYCKMRERAPDLYVELAKSGFLFFKGDLNYRKLVGDRMWPYTTPFQTALCGFEPTSFLALRTLKAETVAGLTQEAVEKVEKKFGKGKTEWMVTGDYAVAQLFDKKS